MFALHFEFPSGKYCAANHAAVSEPEWPPNPARVFAAMVSAAYEIDRVHRGDGLAQMVSHHRKALAWLEAAVAPHIWFPDADVEAAPVSFVPVNDNGTRLNKDSKGRYPHPMYARNQPREFPQTYLLDDPKVVFGWQALPEPDVFKALDELASEVTHLGTAHSFVLARAEATWPEEPARWIPAPHGERFLRVASPGRLAEMDRLFAARAQAALRFTVPAYEALIAYRTAGVSRAAQPVSARHELLLLRLRSLVWYCDDSEMLARAMRRAVMSVMGDAAPTAVHGHDRAAEHVAWLPLPDIGHPHARGRIAGIGVAIPLSMASNERAALLAALGKVTEIRLPNNRVGALAPLTASESFVQALSAQTWTKPSRIHRSVTPIVLDRPPKHKTTDALIASVQASLALAGYQRAVSVEVAFESAWSGAPPVQAIRSTVPRAHVELKFEQPVVGPVLLGRLRNFGIGLLRPATED